EPISALVLGQRPDGWKRDDSNDEPLYLIRSRMAAFLGGHGSVLVVEPTKIAAQRTADAIAQQMTDDDPSCAAIAALAATRLGANHLLVQTLRRGVGFHHAALPSDIQAELEDGICRGSLRYLV